jgi:hypothetical protein
MSTPYDAELRTLRMRYKSAFAAHQGWARKLAEASSSGEKPSPELVERETQASREVTQARAALLAAMARAPGS